MSNGHHAMGLATSMLAGGHRLMQELRGAVKILPHMHVPNCSRSPGNMQLPRPCLTSSCDAALCVTGSGRRDPGHAQHQVRGHVRG